MQVVPHTVQPRSTLTPMQVRRKFNSRSLAGLGDICIDWDPTTGDCIETAPDPTSTSYIPPPTDTPSLWLYGSSAPSTSAVPITSSNQSLWFYNSSAAPTLYAAPGATASAIAQMISSLANMGVQIAKVTSLQPGQTLLPNGTVVGAGQSYNQSGVNISALTSLFSNPTLIMMLALGLIVIGSAER